MKRVRSTVLPRYIRRKREEACVLISKGGRKMISAEAIDYRIKENGSRSEKKYICRRKEKIFYTYSIINALKG